MIEPNGFMNWNPAMRGAYKKGYAAAERRDPPSSCPYDDKRKDNGRLTWSRAFRAAWHDGYEDFFRNEDPLDQYYKGRAASGFAALAR